MLLQYPPLYGLITFNGKQFHNNFSNIPPPLPSKDHRNCDRTRYKRARPHVHCVTRLIGDIPLLSYLLSYLPSVSPPPTQSASLFARTSIIEINQHRSDPYLHVSITATTGSCRDSSFGILPLPPRTRVEKSIE